MNIRRELGGHFKAELLAPAASEWLRAMSSARVLHIFERNINLVNQNKEIVSVVTKELGPGPLTIVLRNENGLPGDFRKWITPEDAVIAGSDILTIGHCSIDATVASLWDPLPKWHMLTERQLFHGVRIVESILVKFAAEDSLANLIHGGKLNDWQLATHDIWSSASLQLSDAGGRGLIWASERLAGLGQGLTPAGDDFIMGVCYALFACRKPPEWRNFAERMVGVASKVTTSLSRSWLLAAGRGEASRVWHTLVESLIVSDDKTTASSALDIVKTGHTSGADSLTGFVLGLNSLRSLTVR